MALKKSIRTILKWMGAGTAVAGGTYATYAAVMWLRYGRPPAGRGDDVDPLLDRFMPAYDIVERHHVRVDAPADVTFTAACEMDLQQSRVVRTIFRAREVLLGSEPESTTRPRGVVPFSKSLGWGVLVDVPGRELVMGAVTQPWEADVVFRPLPPEAFVAFDEPGYVKIAWTLRADPISATQSIFRTETRAVATSATARTKFRRYWSFLSPGIILIRWMGFAPLKAEAERRAAA